MAIHVENRVPVREIEGKASEASAPLKVESHATQRDMVVLNWDGQRLSVDARDMMAAIANARNARTTPG